MCLVFVSLMEEAQEKIVSLEEIILQTENSLKEEDPRAEVTRLKSLFYRTKEALMAESKKQWIEAGNDEESWNFECPEEVRFKELLEEYKQTRAMQLKTAAEAEEKAFEKKKSILDKLSELVENPEDVDKIFPQVRELQQSWKEAGEVSKNKYNELVKKYQILMEKFYDYVKISNELRDYDFKKNIEAKVALCEAAEKLAEEKQLNIAFQKLQNLHSEWRELGPVPREMREEIWNRFKNASDVINKKHAAYYQSKKEEEVENLKKKTALCEAIEAIDLTKISSYKEWDKVTEKVFEIQAEWKKIGFAPKKNNTKIYERFRAACDALFEAKSEYYKSAKDKLAENVKAKKELIEKAEALKDSKKWKETTEKLINLQKQWKKIGAVPNKMSDQLWKRFVSACDAFFEAKAKAQEGEKSINVIRKERDKLIRAYEANRANIATRENNIGFLSIGKSKEENPLVAELLKNIEKLKEDQVELVKKIKALEEKIRNAEEN